MPKIISTTFEDEERREVLDDGTIWRTSLVYHAVWKFDADKKFHCDNGPAKTSPGGYEEWYSHGKRHRLDGPALISPIGFGFWVEGKRHREDGPAIEPVNGYDEQPAQWWIDDVELSEAEFNDWRLQKKLNEELPEKSGEAKRIKI